MLAAFVALLATIPQEPQVSKTDVLRVGQVVEFRGSLDPNGRFLAEKAGLEDATSDDVLISTVPQDEKDPEAFALLGQPVVTDADTQWQGLTRGSLAGQRIKVEGSWKGPTKFHAKTISTRGAGRDRIAGRIDELSKVEGGWEANVMIFTVVFKDDIDVEHERPVETYELAPERKVSTGSVRNRIERDEDDDFGKGIVISDTLRLLGQLEFEVDDFNNVDLNTAAKEDRTDYNGSARLRLAWTPSENLVGVAEVRYHERYRRDYDSGVLDPENDHDGSFGET
jgi:hypothetical protein